MYTLPESMAVILYEDVFNTLVFFLAVWCAGKVSMACRLPALVGEILVGALLGMSMLNLSDSDVQA